MVAMADTPKLTVWTQEDTIDYLRLNPLPADFIWKNRTGQNAAVKPSYNVANYGKWLHETPYFPGLFELIHDLLFSAGSRLPSITTLTDQLARIRRERDGQLKLF